jgi:hypothetical protein
VAGEFYPCKPEIFAATYEKVGAESGAQPDHARDWIRQRGLTDSRVNELFDTVGKIFYLDELLTAYAREVAKHAPRPEQYAQAARQIAEGIDQYTCRDYEEVLHILTSILGQPGGKK